MKVDFKQFSIYSKSAFFKNISTIKAGKTERRFFEEES